MSLQRHFAVCDTETTGLDPDKGHEIIQIAAKAINYFDLSNHHAGEFSILIKPQRPEKADKEALDVIGPLFERAMKEGVHPKVALEAFIKWFQSLNHQNKILTKPVFVGQHAKFDIKFIVATLKEHGLFTSEDDLPWMSNLHFDLQQSSFELFCMDPNIDNLKLDTMLKACGMKERKDKTHDALEDVRLEASYFVRLMKFFRACKNKMKIV